MVNVVIIRPICLAKFQMGVKSISAEPRSGSTCSSPLATAALTSAWGTGLVRRLAAACFVDGVRGEAMPLEDDKPPGAGGVRAERFAGVSASPSAPAVIICLHRHADPAVAERAVARNLHAPPSPYFAHTRSPR